MKRNFYLQHPLMAMHDPRMQYLLKMEKLKGTGAYWFVIEKLAMLPDSCVDMEFLRPYCKMHKISFAQSKLVRVIKGAVLDVAVDIRKGSPTFGHHVAVELTEDNHRQFFIPRGFAHGFSVLSEEVVFQYKCDNFYAPQYEGAIAWDDPDLRIDWRISDNNLILSEKDKVHPNINDINCLFDYMEVLY